MILVAAGSAYFHLAPSPATLAWAFMSFFALVAGDRLGETAGVASVLYWRHTETAGAGGLRFYVFVQFFPVLAVPVLITLPGRYRNRGLGAVIGLSGGGTGGCLAVADGETALCRAGVLEAAAEPPLHNPVFNVDPGPGQEALDLLVFAGG